MEYIKNLKKTYDEKAKQKPMKRFNMNFDINGRIMLNIWRICRSEIKLTDYSLENVINEVSGFKFPFFSNSTLVNWFLESK
jgi:DNA polymerase elongation subunit (family B)